MTSGSWLVVGLLSAGVILALVALKYRRYPAADEWRESPATTQSLRAK
jgi:hypothetical protein